MKKQLAITPVFGMANLTPKRTGLPLNIWSEHSGVKRNVEHHLPRVKVGNNDWQVVIVLSPEVVVKAKNKRFKESGNADFKKTLEYIKKNADLFIRHFNDDDDSFDDNDLFDSLRARGCYK